jgi:hypothetical protein
MMFETDRSIASGFYCVALGLALQKVPAGPLAEMIRNAQDNPSSDTIRAVREAGRHSDWGRLIDDALIEVGIAAASLLECR